MAAGNGGDDQLMSIELGHFALILAFAILQQYVTRDRDAGKA